jgi:hypothetical protein
LNPTNESSLQPLFQSNAINENSEEYDANSDFIENNTENYQNLMKKLKKNPELLFEIIPSSTQSINRKKLREKLRRNNEERKKIFLVKHQIEGSNSPANSSCYHRPDTTGSLHRLYNSKENLDLEHNPPSSTSHYSAIVHNSGSKILILLLCWCILGVKSQSNSSKFQKSKVNPITSNMINLTKEQILKLSDEELQKLLISKRRDGYLSFVPCENQPIRIHKPKLQNHATRLAAELFSYYRPNYKGFSCLHPSKPIRHRLSSAHPDLLAQPDPLTHQVALEDAQTKIKILSHPIDYASEEPKHSMVNCVGSDVTREPNLNKSMPRLLKARIPTSAQYYKQRRRKLDLNKISSHLSKKDYVPRFKIGVREQMEKRKSSKPGVSWYDQSEQRSVISRRIKTASASRNKHNKVSQKSTESQKEINIVTEVNLLFFL